MPKMKPTVLRLDGDQDYFSPMKPPPTKAEFDAYKARYNEKTAPVTMKKAQPTYKQGVMDFMETTKKAR